MIAELPGILSHSQTKQLQGCAGQYWLERVVKAEKRPGWAMLAGNAVHKACDWWDYALLNDGVVRQEEKYLRNLFEVAFDQQIEERLEHTTIPKEQWHVGGRKSTAWPNKETEAYWRSEGWKQIHAWSAWRLNSGWEIAAIPVEGKPSEFTWAIEVDLLQDFAGIPMRMFIDRVMVKDGVLQIVDLKSGTYVPDDDKQLVRYGYGLFKQHGMRARWASYWMGRKGTTTPVVDLSRFTDQQIEYDILAARAQQLSGIFPYKPSRMCPACSVNRFCPEYGPGDLAGTVPQPWEQTGPPVFRYPGPPVMMVEPSDDESPDE